MTDITYYFNTNHASELWTTDAPFMIDNILTNYASTTVDGDIQTLIGNTCPGTDLGIINKVEVRAYAFGDVDDQLIIRPVFTGGIGDNHVTVPGLTPAWGDYQNITNDTNSPETIYEFYNIGDDSSSANIRANFWRAQTFTPSTAHDIEWIKIKIYKLGSPGDVTVGIRATSGGLPTGEDLTSGTISEADISTTVTWVKVKLTSYALSASIKYAIVVRALDGSDSNEIYWRADSSSPTYTGGASQLSINSGVDWTEYTSVDFMFEEGSGTWTWTDVQNLDVNMEMNDVSKGNTMRCSKVEIFVTYTESGVTHEIIGESNGVSSFTTFGSVDWQVISAINAFNQTDGALTKMQTYNFDFSYDDDNWTLSQASIQSGILDITGVSGYGRRNPDTDWYSGSIDDFETEIDFKQDSTGTIGARIEIFVIGDPFTLRFEVRGSEDLMRIHHNGVTRASQAFTDDTSWHTMKVRRVGTTYYMSIDVGDEISWDYGTARVISWIGLQMFGITGDFDNFKYKWKEPFYYLRSGISTISSTIANLEIWKLIAGITNGLSGIPHNFNLNTNPSVEVNLNGYGFSSSTIFRSVTEYYHGVASLACITNNTIANEGWYRVITSESEAGKEYTFSVYLKGSGTVRLLFYDNVSTNQFGSQITLTSTWTRYSLTKTFGVGSTIRRLYVSTDVQQSITFYSDAVMHSESSTLYPFATNLSGIFPINGTLSANTQIISTIITDWQINSAINSQASLINLLSAIWNIDSTINGVSSNTSFLRRIFLVNSIINSISSTTGSLEIWKLITGIIDALSSNTGNILLDKNIVSSVNALSEIISSIIANYALSVETNGVSQTISNILLDRSIIGASNALSQTISNIIANWQITSTINGISQIDTIAKLDMAIISAINGLASTTGDLTQFGTILIEGIANGLSQLISKINADWSINGTLQGQSNYISLLNADWQIDSNIDGISITDGFLKRNFIVDGIINGLSTTTGHTIISRLINSIITGQTTFDGMLKADWSLFGDINSLSQTDGIIYLDKSIIGTINGVSELVSAIIADWSINGISSANTQTTANLIALYELLGTIDGITSTIGTLTLTGEILLEGIINTLTLLNGLGKVDWSISGNTDAISQMDANIIANWALLGNINPLSQTLGDLTLLTEILLAGIISALTQLYGKTNVNRLIGGTFQGQSSNIALLSTIYQILGTTQGQSILDALLGKLFSINGTSQGITTINGLTRIDYSIDGLINGQGQTIGNILRDISLYGTSNAYALLSGNVLLEKLIASIINGVASLDGTLQQVIIAYLITEILKGNSIITKEIFLNSDITKQKDLNSLITILEEKHSKINTN